MAAKAMNGQPISDDYIGALLRVEGVPDDVVIPLLKGKRFIVFSVDDIYNVFNNITYPLLFIIPC